MALEKRINSLSHQGIQQSECFIVRNCTLGTELVLYTAESKEKPGALLIVTVQGQVLLGKWKLDKYSNFTYKLRIHNSCNKTAQKERADYSQLPIWEKHSDTHETITPLNK